MSLGTKLYFVLKAIHFPGLILPHVDLGVLLHQSRTAVDATYS